MKPIDSPCQALLKQITTTSAYAEASTDKSLSVTARKTTSMMAGLKLNNELIIT